MSDDLWPWIAGLLFILNILLSIVCYSLRDFSRSRLDEICKAKKNPDRFGVILKLHERAQLTTDVLSWLALLAFIVFASAWLQLMEPLKSSDSEISIANSIVNFVGLLVVSIPSIVILPWLIARVQGEAFLYRSWPCVNGLVNTARPILAIIAIFDRAAHRVSGRKEPTDDDKETLADEIMTVVDEGQRGGVLQSGTSSMIHRVMELREEDAAAVMTPRTEMFYIQADLSIEEARQALLSAGHTRVPVVGKSPDDIIGILYAKDLLRYLKITDEQPKLVDICREPFYVPESTSIDSLLESMRRSHIHLAIVLDEYGGVAGLVTLEDVLEEIVGEIVDEYDEVEAEQIEEVEAGINHVDGRVHIDDLNERFHYDIPEDRDYDTIGGFVFATLGRIPEPGEEFNWRQLRFQVLDADKRKIIKLQIQVDQELASSASREE